MAMNTNTAQGELAIDINTTPLIDVMLVLLTLLILTLPVQTHAVKLNMPHVTPTTDQSPVIALSIDFDGTTYWNGTAVTRQMLDTYFSQTSTQDPQPEIHVNSNPLAKYNAVPTVLGDAQRLGVTKIGFEGIEQYAN